MEIFLVGGAVRDFIFARLHDAFRSPEEEEAYWERVEKDWVVVGSTPEEMISHGFRPVGKSFPVFLHPKTQEEFALARTERKIGRGYKGFECYSNPQVTLDEDLHRRDLTINAIAAPADFRQITFENIIDPYQGLKDLAAGVFRHVSEAFIEDPVRILRIARLACRFTDFSVHPTTQSLMSTMVTAGEIDALIPERVWQEWFRSLSEAAPWRWFEILDSCEATEKLFPAIQLSSAKHDALKWAVSENAPAPIRLALQLYDIREEALLDLCTRYRLPTEFKDLALMVAKYSNLYFKLAWQPLEILTLFENTDAFRRPDRFYQFITSCYLLERAKTSSTYKKLKLREILRDVLAIDVTPVLQKGLHGKEIADAIREMRSQKIANCLIETRK